MPLTTYAANAVGNHFFRGDQASTEQTQPGEYWVSLHDADPTTAGLLSSEISGGSYTRQLVSFSAPDGGVLTNDDELVFDGLPTSAGIGWIGIWDDQTAGTMWSYDDRTSVPTNSGDAIRIAAGSLSLDLKA